MREPAGTITPEPQKRLFYSIIADYDLKRAICELVDNVLDLSKKLDLKTPPRVSIDLDLEQQTIVIQDNGGGVPRDQLEFLIGPGLTGNDPQDETIGYFGVGTKRAVVAIAQDVLITTRHGSSETFQFRVDDAWLKDDDWRLQIYRVDPLPPGTTRIELTKLRAKIDVDVRKELIEHLGATYALILKRRLDLSVGGQDVPTRLFRDWAFPPRYGPRDCSITLRFPDSKPVRVQMEAGLALESSPTGGDYGIFVYCGERLIARGLRSPEVGFVRGLAGAAHPNISLVRVILQIEGPAKEMPWNSSKSSLNYNHRVFSELRTRIVTLVQYYATLSRGWAGDWPAEVSRYTKGTIEHLKEQDLSVDVRSRLPDLPKFKPRYHEKILQVNRKLLKEKPWSQGPAEGVLASRAVQRLRFESANQYALIVLDSTLEIAFKEYLVNASGTHYSDVQLLNLFKNRALVQTEVEKTMHFPAKLWRKVNHYYNLRCKLVHERASVPVSEAAVEDYREVVERMLREMFGLRFGVDDV